MGCDARGSPGERIQPGLRDENLRWKCQNLLLPRYLEGGGGKRVIQPSGTTSRALKDQSDNIEILPNWDTKALI